MYTLDISACPDLISLYRDEYKMIDEDAFLYINGDNLLGIRAGMLVVTGGEQYAVLVLPASVTVIETEAFAGTAADAVVVPAGCTSVGSRAFAGCPNLKTVYIPAAASVAADAFEDCGNVTVVRTE